jgi:hypothetical protein
LFAGFLIRVIRVNSWLIFISVHQRKSAATCFVFKFALIRVHSRLISFFLRSKRECDVNHSPGVRMGVSWFA